MPVAETPDTAKTHQEAEVRAVVRTLRSYGPLPKTTLQDLVGERHWRDGCLSAVIKTAIAEGRVRALGEDFYEAT